MDHRPIDFYYFSGTGNTLLVARAMAEVFAAHGRHVTLRRIEVTDPAQVDVGRTLGIAFPVAVGTTYPLVWDFVRALPPGRGAAVFMVDTLGGMSGGVVGPMRRALEAKGYRPIGAREIPMPPNIFVKMSDAWDKRRRDRGIAQARLYAEDLLQGRARWGRIPVLSDWVYAIVGSRWMWKLVALTAHRLVVDKAACTRCGLCAEMCPAHNITLAPYPASAGHCQECMRCLTFCPTHALRPAWFAPGRYRAVEARELRE